MKRTETRRYYEIDPAKKLLPQIDDILALAWMKDRIDPHSIYLSQKNIRRFRDDLASIMKLDNNASLLLDKFVNRVTGNYVSIRTFANCHEEGNSVAISNKEADRIFTKMGRYS